MATSLLGDLDAVLFAQSAIPSRGNGGFCGSSRALIHPVRCVLRCGLFVSSDNYCQVGNCTLPITGDCSCQPTAVEDLPVIRTKLDGSIASVHNVTWMFKQGAEPAEVVPVIGSYCLFV